MSTPQLVQPAFGGPSTPVQYRDYSRTDAPPPQFSTPISPPTPHLPPTPPSSATILPHHTSEQALLRDRMAAQRAQQEAELQREKSQLEREYAAKLQSQEAAKQRFLAETAARLEADRAELALQKANLEKERALHLARMSSTSSSTSYHPPISSSPSFSSNSSSNSSNSSLSLSNSSSSSSSFLIPPPSSTPHSPSIYLAPSSPSVTPPPHPHPHPPHPHPSPPIAASPIPSLYSPYPAHPSMMMSPMIPQQIMQSPVYPMAYPGYPAFTPLSPFAPPLSPTVTYGVPSQPQLPSNAYGGMPFTPPHPQMHVSPIPMSAPPMSAPPMSAPMMTMSVPNAVITTSHSSTALLSPLSSGAVSFPVARVKVSIEEARHVAKKDFLGLGKSDPYVIFGFKSETYTTLVCQNTQNPVWYESFEITNVHAGDEICFALWDSDRWKKDDFLGEVRLFAKDIVFGASECYRLMPRRGHSDRITGDLRIKFQIL